MITMMPTISTGPAGSAPALSLHEEPPHALAPAASSTAISGARTYHPRRRSPSPCTQASQPGGRSPRTCSVHGPRNLGARRRVASSAAAVSVAALYARASVMGADAETAQAVQPELVGEHAGGGKRARVRRPQTAGRDHAVRGEQSKRTCVAACRRRGHDNDAGGPPVGACRSVERGLVLDLFVVGGAGGGCCDRLDGDRVGRQVQG